MKVEELKKSMGLPHRYCRRCAIKDGWAKAEVCMNWILFNYGNAKKTAKISYFFQVAQTNTDIATFQRMGINDLVKKQMEKINWIRKTAQEYSEDF